MDYLLVFLLANFTNLFETERHRFFCLFFFKQDWSWPLLRTFTLIINCISALQYKHILVGEKWPFEADGDWRARLKLHVSSMFLMALRIRKETQSKQNELNRSVKVPFIIFYDLTVNLHVCGRKAIIIEIPVDTFSCNDCSLAVGKPWPRPTNFGSTHCFVEKP